MVFVHYGIIYANFSEISILFYFHRLNRQCRKILLTSCKKLKPKLSKRLSEFTNLWRITINYGPEECWRPASRALLICVHSVWIIRKSQQLWNGKNVTDSQFKIIFPPREYLRDSKPASWKVLKISPSLHISVFPFYLFPVQSATSLIRYWYCDYGI